MIKLTNPKSCSKFNLSPIYLALASSLFANQVIADSDQTIVVFGEKTEKSIFDTSSSVQVFDQDTIESLPNATDWRDLAKLTPNLSDTGNDNFLPALRGIDGSGPAVGGLASFSGTASRLNLSIDGRSLSYTEMAFGARSLWDMQQAEIYVGPQSLIQGRNSSAGAIVLKSNDPTYHFESSAKTAIGQRGYSQNSAMISAPIIADQVAFRLSADQQKKLSHLALEGYPEAGDPREISATTARAKLLITPEKWAGFKSILSYTFMDTKAPQSENLIGPRMFTAERPSYETTSDSFNWFTSITLNSNVSLENSLIYTQSGYVRSSPDSDYAYDVETDEITIEPLLRFQNTSGSFKGLFGGRYSAYDQDERLYYNPTTSQPMKDESETYSLFTEGTYDSGAFFSTLGLRFEQEEKTRIAKLDVVDLDYNNKESVFLPKLDLGYRFSDTSTFGFKIAKGYNAGAAGVSFDTTQARRPHRAYQFDEESVINYELYSKVGFADNTGLFTANLFFNDYDNIQLQQNADDGYVFIANVDDARTFGAELGIQYYLTDDIEVFSNIGLLKTEFKETAAQGGKERELPRSPSVTANLGASYYITENLFSSFNTSFSGDYFTDLSNTEQIKIDSYSTTNVQLSYAFESGKVSLFATNVFDSNKETNYFSIRIPDQPLVQEPRLVGASLELNF